MCSASNPFRPFFFSPETRITYIGLNGRKSKVQILKINLQRNTEIYLKLQHVHLTTKLLKPLPSFVIMWKIDFSHIYVFWKCGISQLSPKVIQQGPQFNQSSFHSWVTKNTHKHSKFTRSKNHSVENCVYSRIAIKAMFKLLRTKSDSEGIAVLLSNAVIKFISRYVKR